MKLAEHYTRTSVYITLTVLLFGAVIYYFAINYIAQQQLDRGLQQQLTEAEEYARSNDQNPQLYDLDRDHAVFVKTNLQQLQKRFFDTTYFNPKEQRAEAGRAVEDLVKVKSSNYKVVIAISRAGQKYLIEVITIITLTLLAGLLFVLFITNKYLLKGLWKPFQLTLKEIKQFNIADVDQFTGKPSEVDEFTELNEAIREMSLRVTHDYLKLKQFTENASHEMMTPLAVVTTKLDTLIQDETLGANQLAQITDIYSSINKSSRLNQSLLLLAKLENKLITEEEPIELDIILAEKMQQFQELMQSKNLSLQHQLQPKQILASKYLVDILLNNLFSNAIRHNNTGGVVIIQLTTHSLSIKNSGGANPLNTDLIFERFQKGKESQGTGLGLTLVKNICQHYGYTIHYHHETVLHAFVITF
ncbi:sensor histidine kinase [Mucilaginibacter ginsenosidivorax]|uniref:histidine kinase n=1 Tax=Mucilaginibacter ginsenosidivorax TaxID=862126 RepID=A0A5B8W4P0_9SPHI|nr:HAMP domain-containing sensor histidine kinase [Mucilaginibacter ginsenosidivorax]QEC78824.1 HAMP domain-containing histidine kinase [Mucilaginibacter ginsenosidivorax]